MSAGFTSYDTIRRELKRGLGRFRSTTPQRVIRDLVRAVRLHRKLPAPRVMAARRERLVVSLTTVPDRAGRIQPALRSLLDQTCPADRIVLAWPTHSVRTGAPYPSPPPLPASVELLACEDSGPATKLLPALRAEPDALIIAVDDDVVYPRDFLETLLAAHAANPAAALGWRGWRLQPGVDPRHFDHVFATAVSVPTPVDVLLGTWGYLVPPGALDEAVHGFGGFPPEVRWVDDVWISGHLARRGVARYVIPARGLPIETAASLISSLTSRENRSGHNDRIAIEAFAPWW